jgi:hypothetical protein
MKTIIIISLDMVTILITLIFFKISSGADKISQNLNEFNMRIK